MFTACVRRLTSLANHSCGFSYRSSLLRLAVLAGFLSTLIGLPMPAPQAKDSSTPFPCQHCACSCNSAATCWQRCCCHTLEERIAWAKRHKATIPKFALALQALKPPGSQLQAASSCCDHSDESALVMSCCSPPKSQRGSDEKAQEASAANSKSPSRTVTLLGVAKCRGLVTAWLITALAAPIADPSIAPGLPPAQPLWVRIPFRPAQCTLEPPTPPPRGL